MAAGTTSTDALRRRSPSIELRDVRIERGGRVVLSVVALELGAGLTSLIGPNGSGKSTLLHALVGLLPGAGSIRVLDMPPSAARRQVSYVIQAQHAPSHLPITVREVVALGRAAQRGPWRPLRAPDRAAVDAALERMGLGAVAGRHLAELSGGQRQRAFVAQGLAQDAEVLLLDEPTAGLDLPSTDAIRRVVAEEAASGRTVVVATHDLADASASDVVVLLAGRVVAAGAPPEVLTRPHLQEAYGGRLVEVGEAMLLDDGSHHDSGRHDPDDHGHTRTHRAHEHSPNADLPST